MHVCGSGDGRLDNRRGQASAKRFWHQIIQSEYSLTGPGPDGPERELVFHCLPVIELKPRRWHITAGTRLDRFGLDLALTSAPDLDFAIRFLLPPMGEQTGGGRLQRGNLRPSRPTQARLSSGQCRDNRRQRFSLVALHRFLGGQSSKLAGAGPGPTFSSRRLLGNGTPMGIGTSMASSAVGTETRRGGICRWNGFFPWGCDLDLDQSGIALDGETCGHPLGPAVSWFPSSTDGTRSVIARLCLLHRLRHERRRDLYLNQCRRNVARTHRPH